VSGTPRGARDVYRGETPDAKRKTPPAPTHITVLEAGTDKPQTKVFRRSGVTGCARAMWFTAHVLPAVSFNELSALLTKLEAQPDRMIVLGSVAARYRDTGRIRRPDRVPGERSEPCRRKSWTSKTVLRSSCDAAGTRRCRHGLWSGHLQPSLALVMAVGVGQIRLHDQRRCSPPSTYAPLSTASLQHPAPYYKQGRPGPSRGLRSSSSRPRSSPQRCVSDEAGRAAGFRSAGADDRCLCKSRGLVVAPVKDHC
jgi:hypothetical protein